MEDGTVRRDTWEYDGSSWQRIDTNHAPLTTGPMVYHAGLEKILIYANYAYDEQADSEFWTYDGYDWECLDLDVLPPARENPSMTYDPDQDRVLFFGGHHNQRWTRDIYYADTWEFRL